MEISAARNSDFVSIVVTIPPQSLFLSLEILIFRYEREILDRL